MTQKEPLFQCAVCKSKSGSRVMIMINGVEKCAPCFKAELAGVDPQEMYAKAVRALKKGGR